MTHGSSSPTRHRGVEENEDWLTPDFLIPSGARRWNTCRVAMRPGYCAAEVDHLLDTGIGNHKERPYIPSWSHLVPDIWPISAAVGVAPDDFDIVVNPPPRRSRGLEHSPRRQNLGAHFQNAEYFMPSEELEFWIRRTDTNRYGPRCAERLRGQRRPRSSPRPSATVDARAPHR